MYDVDVEKKVVAILNILKDAQEPIGSRIISRELLKYGFELSERTVRYHLRIMDEKGLTKCFGRHGRTITEKGLEEANNALVSDKIGMVQNRVDILSYQTTFDIERQSGDVILNISLVPIDKFERALKIMKTVFRANLCVSDMVAHACEGENFRNLTVPENMVAFGTVCAFTINGVLLNHRIPVYSKFGGILQIEDKKPSRFTEVIFYSGTSLDPAEIFIKGKMTDVKGAVNGEEGKILASFREIPAVCLDAARKVIDELKEIGFGGVIAIGRPSQPLLGIPVSTGSVGMVILAGLNPLAAVEESGIETQNKALCVMMDFRRLKSVWECKIVYPL